MEREPLLKKPQEEEPEIKVKNGVKNGLVDLHDHLFMQLERLNDESLIGEELLQEIERSDAITKVSSKIIENANLMLKAKVAADNAMGKLSLPSIMLKEKST